MSSNFPVRDIRCCEISSLISLQIVTSVSTSASKVTEIGVSMAALRALLPAGQRDIPAVLYFNENQLTYTLPDYDERDCLNPIFGR